MKKRIMFIMICFIASAGNMAAETYYGYDAAINGLYYKLDQGKKTATVTYYSVYYGATIYDCYSGCYNQKYYITTANIPSTITYGGQTYTVTSIGNNAFRSTSLSSVTIPNTITSIGSSAFPVSVSAIYFTGTIEEWCNKDWYPSAISSSYDLYINDAAATNVTISNNATSIGDYAFVGCSNLTSVKIGNSVVSIGDDAFKGCTNLKKVTLNSDAIVGKQYTYNSNIGHIFGSQVTEYIIGNNVTSIGEWAFAGCDGLTSVTIGNSVVNIGDRAFNGCTGLTSVTIPNSVTSIGEYAFQGCAGLTSVTIGNSVVNIGDYAFDGCTGLTSVTIPNSVTSIGLRAFSYCMALTSIDVSTNNPNYCSIDGVLFDKNKTTLIQYPINKQGTTYTIPNSVTSIGDWAFVNCPALTAVTIPNSVTSIGNSAFWWCTSLTSVIIPNSVKSIGENAFYHCVGLTSESIPNSVTTIGAMAFYECSGLTSILIPENVIEIGAHSFAGCLALTSVEWNARNCTVINSYNISTSLFSLYSSSDDIRKKITSFTIGADVRSLPDSLCFGLTNLKTIKTYAETPPLLGKDVFKNAYSNPTIYVPCNMKTAYQTDWNQFAASCYQYAPANYLLSLRANDYAAGSVSKVSIGNSCEGHVFKATANTGYHFVQWTDGDAENPRTVILTQDTTFTAEFAMDTYIISTQVNYSERGTVSGGATVYYNDNVTLTATPNYGYYFSYWKSSNNKTSYANPYTFTVTESSTYTAYFDKKTYYIDYNYNSTQGTVIGSEYGEYLDHITFRAEPEYGYHFVQWSDGVKDNPRSITLTQDTTFRALFAVDKSGKCGTDMQLTWNYDSNTRTLTISGNGALNDNYTYGVEAPVEMKKLVIGNNVTSIGENAFKGFETLESLIIGEQVKTIKDAAFAGCLDVIEIYNYRSTPTTAYSYAFDEYLSRFDCKLYVLASSIDMYKRANVWKDFYYIIPIGAGETTLSKSDVSVVPGENTAQITWPISDDAATYTLDITINGVVYCSLVFNSDKQLIGISFAPSRNGQTQAPAATLTANGMQFTVTGLNSGTTYGLSVVAKNAANAVVASYESAFTTTGGYQDIEESIEEIDATIHATKVIRDGQLYILRNDGAIFNASGIQVE